MTFAERDSGLQPYKIFITSDNSVTSTKSNSVNSLLLEQLAVN
jgi:hypothetical protein